MAEKELCNLDIFVVAKWEPHVRNGDSICCQMSVQVYIYLHLRLSNGVKNEITIAFVAWLNA